MRRNARTNRRVPPGPLNGPEAPFTLLAHTWLRAETYAGSGGVADTWLDKSGNGRNFTASGTGRPATGFTAGELGWQPVMRFDGSNDYFIYGGAATDYDFLHNGNGCEVFIVKVIRRSGNTANTLLSSGDGGTTATGRGLMIAAYSESGATLTASIRMSQVCTGAGRIINDQPVGSVQGEPTLIDFYYLEGRAGNEWSCTKTKNGSSTGNTGNSSSAPSAGAATYALNIGRNGAGTNYAQADIAEIVIFNRVLTTNERSTLTTYFHNRYGFVNAVTANSTEVYLGIGDSEMLGRGDPTSGLPSGYPPSGTQVLQMNNNSGIGYAIKPVTEPTGDGAWTPVGVGPLGMTAWRRNTATGKRTVIANTGVGGAKSSQWVPGTANYYDVVRKGRAVMSAPGTILKGIVLYDGLNDATLATGDTDWNTNWFTTTLPALITEFGTVPIYIVRYPPTVPTDTSYPTHAALRTVIGSKHGTTVSGSTVTVVDAPDGPWVEGTKVHLSTTANDTASSSLSAVM